MKTIVKERNIPIFKGKFILIVSNSEKKVKKITGVKIKNIYAHALNYKYKGNDALFIILNFKAASQISHAIIAHECTHVANMLLANRGVIIDSENDETHAYVGEWFNRQVHKWLDEESITIARYIDNE